MSETKEKVVTIAVEIGLNQADFLALTNDYASIADITLALAQKQWKTQIVNAAQNYANAYTSLLAEQFKDELASLEEEKQRRMDNLNEAVKEAVTHAAATMHQKMSDASYND